jgi:hypothetical protein
MTLKAPATEMALRLLLDDVEARLAEANRAYAAAQWQSHFDLAERADLARLERARSDALLDSQIRALLDGWDAKPTDAALARRLTLLLRHFQWAAIESEAEIYSLRNRIDHTIRDFRPQVNGDPVGRVERSRILLHHPEQDLRREAWTATGRLSEQIQPDVIRLMHLREKHARRQGFDDYIHWALETLGLGHAWVTQFLKDLRLRTDRLYDLWLRHVAERHPAPKGLRPWDLTFAAEQGCPLPPAVFSHEQLRSAAQRVADSFGLTHAAAGVRVAVTEIPYAAVCYAISPPDDVRILLSPRDDHTQHDVLFHEFGHAVHWRSVGTVSPILRTESPAFNEGMAYLWERLASEPQWLMERYGIGPDRAAGYQRWRAARALYRLRLFIAHAEFEFQAYAALRNGQDLLYLFRQIHSDILGVPFDAAPGWAYNPFWTSHPVYWQNYVIGYAIASQSLVAIKHAFGSLAAKPEVGDWLMTHYYASGAAIRWRDKVRRATGAPLCAVDVVADLTCCQPDGA